MACDADDPSPKQWALFGSSLGTFHDDASDADLVADYAKHGIRLLELVDPYELEPLPKRWMLIGTSAGVLRAPPDFADVDIEPLGYVIEVAPGKFVPE